MSYFGNWLTGIVIFITILIFTMLLAPLFYPSISSSSSANSIIDFGRIQDFTNYNDNNDGTPKIADSDEKFTAKNSTDLKFDDTKMKTTSDDANTAGILQIDYNDAEQMLSSGGTWKSIEDGYSEETDEEFIKNLTNFVVSMIPKTVQHGAGFEVILPEAITNKNINTPSKTQTIHSSNTALPSNLQTVTDASKPQAKHVKFMYFANSSSNNVLLNSNATNNALTLEETVLETTAQMTACKTDSISFSSSDNSECQIRKHENLLDKLDLFSYLIPPAKKLKTFDIVPVSTESNDLLKRVKNIEYNGLHEISQKSIDSEIPKKQNVSQKGILFGPNKNGGLLTTYLKTDNSVESSDLKMDSPTVASMKTTVVTTLAPMTVTITTTAAPMTMTTTTTITTAETTLTITDLKSSRSSVVIDTGSAIIDTGKLKMAEHGNEGKNLKTSKTSVVSSTKKLKQMTLKVSARLSEDVISKDKTITTVRLLKPPRLSNYKPEAASSTSVSMTEATRRLITKLATTMTMKPMTTTTTTKTATIMTTTTKATVMTTIIMSTKTRKKLTTAKYNDDTESEVKIEEMDDDEGDDYYDDFFPTRPSFTSTTASIMNQIFPTFEHAHRHQHEQYDLQSPVIVTALFDIGRGKWPKYTRTYEQYLSYLEHLLMLRNRLVIYTDSRGAQHVRERRNAHNTQIFEMSMRDLPLYRFREEMEEIIRQEQNDWKFDPRTRDHPEANSADYNIIVNSKPYFLYNATQTSRFRNSDSVFAWIDAGYGHGRKGIIPANCHWRPKLRRDRITVIKVTPAHDKISRYSISNLYRVDWAVISGGFIAGDSYATNRFYRFFHKTFLELLDSGRIDDDQTVLTLTLKNYASIFNQVTSNGDWYAIFRLFPCH